MDFTVTGNVSNSEAMPRNVGKIYEQKISAIKKECFHPPKCGK